MKKIIVTFAVMAFIPSLFSAPQGFIEKCQNTFFTLWRPFVLFPGFLDDSKPKTCATHTLQKHTTGPLGLLDLPDEMLLHIISFLGHPNDYLDLALSCTRFYGLMQDPKALAFFVAKFPDPSLDQTLGWQVTLERHAETFFKDIEWSEEGLKLSQLFHNQDNIASLPRAIKELIIDHYFFNDESSSEFILALSRFLGKNKTLKTLWVTAVDPGPKAKIALAQTLRTNHTLTKLILDDPLSIQTSIALSAMLQHNKTLCTLDFRNAHITKKAGIIFCMGLEGSTSLTTLRLSDNTIDSPSVQGLIKALQRNKTIQTLDLNIKFLKPSDGILLAESFRTNTTLSSLKWRGIDTAIALSLAKGISMNMALMSLALPWNELENESGIALAEALETNTNLTALNLSCNNLRDDAGQAFAKALRINRYLVKLDLSDNRFINETGRAFLEALKKNATLKVFYLNNNDSLNISLWEFWNELGRHKNIKIHLGKTF